MEKDRYTDKVYSELSFFVWACCSLRQSADPTKAQPDVGCMFQSLNFWHGVNVTVNSNSGMSCQLGLSAATFLPGAFFAAQYVFYGL